jgi:hypothetical protein
LSGLALEALSQLVVHTRDDLLHNDDDSRSVRMITTLRRGRRRRLAQAVTLQFQPWEEVDSFPTTCGAVGSPRRHLWPLPPLPPDPALIAPFDDAT